MGERGLASDKTVGSYSPVVTVTHGEFFGTANQYVYTLHQEVGQLRPVCDNRTLKKR
jgi:hypothetical protein